MAIGISLFTILVVALAIASIYHRRKVKEHLLKEIPADEPSIERAGKLFGIESAGAIGVPLFDVLYNTFKLNVHALRGINHLHHAQNFDSLSDLTTWMKENILKSSEGKEWRQIIHKYKGYTGEELAFDHLREAGHAVDVPLSGTAEGVDAVVDGQPINVKITDSPSYIQEHLNANPDVPVYTNVEMSDAFSENTNVIIDSDISAQDIFHSTSDTLEGLGDLGSTFDFIPLMTLGLAAIKHAKKTYNGDKDIKTAVGHIALDTAGAGLGGYTGSQIGLALGLVLAPVSGGTSAIIIPAVATLIGSLLGVAGGKKITNFFKEGSLREATEVLKATAKKLNDDFLLKSGQLIIKARQKLSDKIELANNLGKFHQGWVMRLLFPSVETTFYSLCKNRMKEELPAIDLFYNDLKAKCSSLAPEEGGLLLLSQGRQILFDDTTLLASYENVQNAYAVVNLEKKRCL